MVYKPLAVRVALIAGFRRALPVFSFMIVVTVAVVMWESCRDFQGVWEGWKAGFLAFHAFHTPAFPWLAFLCLGNNLHAQIPREPNVNDGIPVF
jgi:hypothetical protein